MCGLLGVLCGYFTRLNTVIGEQSALAPRSGILHPGNEVRKVECSSLSSCQSELSVTKYLSKEIVTFFRV